MYALKIQKSLSYFCRENVYNFKKTRKVWFSMSDFCFFLFKILFFVYLYFLMHLSLFTILDTQWDFSIRILQDFLETEVQLAYNTLVSGIEHNDSVFVYSWPLNNMGLNCIGSFICIVFNKYNTALYCIFVNWQLSLIEYMHVELRIQRTKYEVTLGFSTVKKGWCSESLSYSRVNCTVQNGLVS